MNITKLSYGDKPLLCVVDYIMTNFLPKWNNIVILIPPEIDIEIIEQLCTGWIEILKFNKKINTDVHFLCLGKNVFHYFQKKSIQNEPEQNVVFEHQFEDIVNIIKLQKYEKNKPFCIITKENFLSYKVPGRIKTLNIKINDKINFDKLLSELIDLGYKRVNYVETIGEFAIRGEIFDIWPNLDFTRFTETKPLRIVFDDIIVKEIKLFDVFTQRSIPFTENEYIKDKTKFELEIFPVSLTLTDSSVQLSDLLPEDKIILQIENTLPEEPALSNYYKTIRYFGDEKKFLADMTKYKNDKYTILIGYNYDYELNKLKEIVHSNEDIKFYKTSLGEGFYNVKEKFLFTTYSEIFTKFDYYYKTVTQKLPTGIRMESLWEIQPENYVVHRDYGIGKFLGINIISYGDKTGEFITILYKDNALVHVPVTEFNKVEKFVSLTTRAPKLSSIDGISWQQVKKRVKESVRKFILDLYEIYSARKKLSGYKCAPDNELENLLEESFGYEETEDQKKAIQDVKKDMCSTYPMDRLIIGDVGFGKTEVALRAAFKCVLNGRQVAVLCPTTILAEQHYRTLVDRLSAFAVNIGILTRLQNKKEVQKTIQEINQGKIDIIIGTHILLNEKIVIPNLGLVIIDEEHRFGVRQKEKIRLKYKNFDTDKTLPDVLSLSATPIPRSLAMGLEGIKDVSLIETPPTGRLPIETYVLPYDEKVIFSSISKELSRNGQVYYVYNDISLIEHKTNYLKKLFPSAKIEFIHSKLPSKKIESTMMKFINQEIQCIVTTTIIEAGLDMPNVNTIIVENADRFGLAQLYQLRGRVGRRDIKAYCYLLYNPERLTLNAKKRLSALQEFTMLGSGYRLALRDLEIRGAGEILGTKQHGFVNEVGLSMYSSLVQEILSEISYEHGLQYYPSIPVEKEEVRIELPIDAYIPEEYIPDGETRIIFYRKLLQTTSLQQINEIKYELYDRFGKIKKDEHKNVLENLFNIATLRVLLKKYNARKIWRTEDKICVEFNEPEYVKLFIDKIQKEISFVIERAQNLVCLSSTSSTCNLIEMLISHLG